MDYLSIQMVKEILNNKNENKNDSKINININSLSTNNFFTKEKNITSRDLKNLSNKIHKIDPKNLKKRYNSNSKKIEGNLRQYFLNRVNMERNNQINLSSSCASRHMRSVSNNNLK